MRRALPAVLAALLLAAFAACGSAGEADSGPRSTPAFGVVLDGNPVTPSMIAAASASTGVPVRLVLFYEQWPADPAEKRQPPTASLEAIRAVGAVPCITWEPMSIGVGGAEAAIPAERILAGAYDAYIDEMARAIRGYGAPVLMRLAHEMNLERYHWGTDKAAYGPGSPELYKAMFRRVAERFRAQGAANALFVFCPNVDSIPAAAWNTAGAYYPGDAHVDVLGMDGYNWGTSHTRESHGYDSSFRSFRDIFGPLRKELKALAPSKPLMVFETASASAGGDKAKWAEQAFDTAASWGLAAVVWFEVDKEQDWPLRKNAKADPAPGVRRHVSDDPAWLDRLRGARP